MSDSSDETALQLPTAPAPAPAPAAAALSDEQQAFLDECEAQFAHRFSDDDPEFVRQVRQGTPEPPVMVPWFSRRPWQGRGGRGGRGGGRDFRDDRDRSGGRYHDRDRSHERDRSYGRDRSGGRDGGDRGWEYGDDRRHGHGGGNRPPYRDGRPGGSGHHDRDRRPYY